MSKIVIYCDGSCNNKTKMNGGYGIYIRNHHDNTERQFFGGQYINSTSIRQEMRAIIEAMKKLETGENTIIFTDNQFCVNAITKGWLARWEREKYKKTKNADLWKQFQIQYRRLGYKISFEWIRGHNGTIGNEIADQLAKLGGQRKEIINDNGEEININL